MINRDLLHSRLADVTFTFMRAQNIAHDLLKFPVISTARPFSNYRRVFFQNRSEAQVLQELAGKRIIDVGCGLTPYAPDSMFQVCRRAGIEFYGVDPKIGAGFQFGPFDRFKAFVTGSRGALDPNAPGLDKAVAAFANELPFEAGFADVILSSWLLFVWIHDPAVLAPIFAEFLRVLKPGGSLRIYPHSKCDESQILYTKLADVLQKFDVCQRFLGSLLPTTQVVPAYVTTFTKR